MATMINCGKKLIRISPKDATKIEFSTNNGLSWIKCFNGQKNVGTFSDLSNNGKEILGTTDKGLFYSTNECLTWILRSR